MQRVTAAPSGGIFIGCRRQDASHLAGRLDDRLADRFGDAQIFMDVDTIERALALDPDPAVERTLRLGHELNGLDAVLRPVVLEGAPGDRELFDRLLARVGFADLNG